MRSAVMAAFPSFTESFEGKVPWMYLDRLGIVTTGVGNNIDPVNLAFGLGWTVNGISATPGQIRDAWQRVKDNQQFKGLGGGNIVFQNLTGLRLSPEAIDTLVRGKMLSEEKELRGFFPNWDDIPADAQQAIMSMAWAMGAGKLASFPKFRAFVNQEDYESAAFESHMNNPDSDKALERRNDANRALLQNAAEVVQGGFDRDMLFYPGTPGSGTAEQPTTPATPNAKRGNISTLLFLLGAGSTLYYMFRK